MIDMDENKILTLLNARNEQALRDAVTLYGDVCRSVARNITGSDDDAEECLNDALLVMWNAIPPAKPEHLRAYLLRLVRNAALDRYRAERSEKRGCGQISSALGELEELLPSADSVEGELDRRELLRAITQFLGTLDRRQRDLFMRRYWYGASYADLAQMFGITETNIRVMLSRLRKKMQNHLRKEGLL